MNGFALGGGCELALSCDFIYASAKAKIGQPETGLGLIPGFGGTSRLVRRVGIAWAKELVLVADPISATEAQQIRLVNRVFEPEELLPAAIAAGERIASRGPVAQHWREWHGRAQTHAGERREAVADTVAR